MLEPDGFPALLRSRLLEGDQIRVYHVSTPSAPCPPLFAPGPGRSEEATSLESHFLCISQPGSSQSDVLVLGIEVLIFTTTSVTTVFVSKADSTGLLARSTTGASHRTSLAQTTITAFLEFLLKSRTDRGRLVLSLFARSQNQYLFPGSIENVTKHVLDDRQLIKWWCRVLDPLARKARTESSPSVQAHVVVPGCDSGETRAFFPPSSRSDSSTNPIWLNAYPVNLLVTDASLPPRCLVPRLPDDPKSRFLDDLDSNRDQNGTWRGIQTLEEFWEMMSYRQECSAGRLVGFIWIVFTLTDTTSKRTDQAVNDEIFTPHVAHEGIQHHEQQSVSNAKEKTSAGGVDNVDCSLSARAAKALSSIDPDAKTTSTMTPTTLTEASAVPGAEMSVKDEMTAEHSTRPANTLMHNTAQSVGAQDQMILSEAGPSGGLVLSADQYQTLMDELLQLDFAGEDMAIESTQKWQAKAKELAGAAQFGIEVEGIHIVGEKKISMIDMRAMPTINTIMGVRKKRKAEQQETVINSGAGEKIVANTLATNLIRKKAKS